MYLAKIYVTLKPTVNDPQGITVLGGLKNMGYASVSEVRVGKFLEIKIDEPNPGVAESIANEVCEKLLANPVIEQYSVELVKLNTHPD